MTIFNFFTFTSVIFLIITLKFLFQTRRFRNLPPGPPYLPIIGNLHQLKQPFHRTFHAISQKYGEIFSLWFGSRLVVVVSSASAVQECFTKNDIILANRPDFLFGKYIGYNNTIVTASSYDDHWRNLRRIIALEVLSSHRLNSFSEIRRDEILRLIKNLARDSCNEFSKVELKSKFSEMTFNTIMRMVSGKRYYGEDCDVTGGVEEARQFRGIINELFSLGGANNPSDFLAILRWFDLDDLEKKLKRISKTTDAFLQRLIHEHRNAKQKGNSMIDHLLIQQQSQPEYYTDQIIKGLILVLLLAGTDTSAITLEWAMSNLLNNLDILKKAKNEIDTHIEQDHLIDETDIPKLPYLQNIVYETLRLHPAAPLLLPHLSSQDCSVGEYNVPHNTILLVNAWTIHRDPKLWSDPICFKPERFDKEGEASKLLSFGQGRRACPGENLAQRTVVVTLGLLIQCFEWKRIAEKRIDMNEGKGSTVPKKFALEVMCKVSQIMTNKKICYV